jgi:hypothetical protein
MTTNLDTQLKHNTYVIFREYYDGLIMTKIKDVNSYSMYYAKIQTMLKSVKRYIIAVIPQDINIPGTKKMFNDMEWVSLQAREIDEDYKLEQQIYHPSKYALAHLGKIILIKNKSQPNEQSTAYSIEYEQLPINVVMLHTSSSTMYPNKLPLELALKEFKIVIVQI